MKNQEKIKEAKELLKKEGFFVDNLWHIDDIKSNFKCDDDDAQEVLYSALTNEATMDQIWYAIRFHAEDEGLEENQIDDNNFVRYLREY